MRRSHTTFFLDGYVGLSPLGLGILYPIFKAKSLNTSFAQEVGRDGRIISFIPFYDFEYFTFFTGSARDSTKIGDVSIYAFRDIDGRICELDFDAIGASIRLGDPLTTNENLDILTRLSLARIGRATQSRQVRLLREFSENRLSPLATRIISSAHVKSAQEYEVVWDRIDSEKNDLPDTPPKNDFRNLNSEDIFAWLYENSYDSKWSLALWTLVNKIFYDDRIFELIARMISSPWFDFIDSTKIERKIVGHGLTLYTSLGGMEDDFADAMSDYAASGDIFSLSSVVSIETIVNFIEKLDANGKLEGTAVDIYMDRLTSDVIESSLAYVLVDKILDSSLIEEPYALNTIFEGKTRKDVLRDILKYNGRIGLVMHAKDRRYYMGLVGE